MDFFQNHPTIWAAIQLVLTAVATFFVVSIALRLEKKAMKKLMGKHNNINLRFVESIARFIVMFLAMQWVVMSSPITQPFGRVLFQGTTVIAAIAGFAAQPVIADMICGLMLTTTKPFNIGDRIEFEDGSAGIVKDITMRHVTLQGVDTAVRIIPNSRLNSMIITNMSYQSTLRSIHLRFNISYDADVRHAMTIIGRAVEDSPYTVAGKKQSDDTYGYAPIYFMEYADSSLVMATTVYYESKSPTEVVRSDINTRVKDALDANNIEIPYNYVHVVTDK